MATGERRAGPVSTARKRHDEGEIGLFIRIFIPKDYPRFFQEKSKPMRGAERTALHAFETHYLTILLGEATPRVMPSRGSCGARPIGDPRVVGATEG